MMDSDDDEGTARVSEYVGGDATGTTAPSARPATLNPLESADPPRIGDFWLDARVGRTPAGMVYSGHDDDGPVLLVMLTAGSAEDLAARDRFAGAVNELHIDTVVARGGQGQDEGRLSVKYRAEDDDPVGPDDLPLAPWAALRFDGTAAAVAEGLRLLRAVDLSDLPSKGRPSGPAYTLHWQDTDRPGRWRLWPLPWPGRNDRAGWITILVSWLLMMLIAFLAVVIAIVLFRNAPQEQPPPPVPTTMTTMSSPQSGSPSSGSASPSSASASPTPSDSSGGPKQNPKL